MLVYRMAHTTVTDGRGVPAGPYGWTDGIEGWDIQRDQPGHRMGDAHSGDPDRPGPFNDRIKSYGHEFYFGCPSLSALRSWFAGWLETLYTHGFAVHTYDAPDDEVYIGVSGRQCAFNIKNSKLVEIMTYDTIAVR